jgi:putative toxin-antitoxin system toxin component, PIN family
LIKVVLDTNIFISGIMFGGNPRKIIELIIEGKIQLCISSEILLEIKEVLERDKFSFSPTITQQIIFEIESL